MCFCAIVLEARCDGLLVRSRNTEIFVHTCDAHLYCPGDVLCICHAGRMTMSLPPQVTACRITLVRHCQCGDSCNHGDHCDHCNRCNCNRCNRCNRCC